MKLSVHLLTFNGAQYIPYLFNSLRAQTFQDWQLLVIDNASEDGTPEALRKKLENFSQPWQLIENKKNIGFARGHNQLLRELTVNSSQFTAGAIKPLTSILSPKGRGRGEGADYILMLNQDVILAPDYLEKLAEFMEANPQAGAAQGILLKWNFGEELGIDNADVIDSLGLKVLQNRQVIDWGVGQRISNFQFPISNTNPFEVFGVSGALPMYRRKALEEIMINGEIFDEDFFSYKEDVDLAFRLRSAGWKAYLVPQARAWHDRSSEFARHEKPAFINYHSYKNHLFVLIKNEYSANLLRDWPRICWYELKKFIYLLFFERQTLAGLREVWRLLPRMLEKRRAIKSKRKLFAREIRKWFS